MQTIETGNVEVAGARTRGWFVGDLVRWATERGESFDGASTPRQNLDVQVKWYTHPPDDVRVQWAPPDPFYTLTIIIDGSLVLDMHSVNGESTSIALVKRGDYIMWYGPQYAHSWHTESGCTLITVRWPV